ncbi:MAG: hypothetical protein KBT27_03930 [Prevotellaceae bacterium]|nr:hypothetical protein [Candidatus Faecinaster equi]
MIFLSASVPVLGRKYYDTSNPTAITSAVVAFAKVCAEYELEVYFGGHPSITPLLLRAGIEINPKFGELVHIYQSREFDGMTPIELSEYANLHKTNKQANRDESLEYMRDMMISVNKTDCAVFIGGMEGILLEADLIEKYHPEAKILPIGAGGGASYTLLERYHIDDPVLADSMAFIDVFRKYLKEFEVLNHV